ncbi:MAG: hypothetical protein LBE49_09395 [Deltaproteobacteria bacterium]|nr:hypothetical protein [Deltaproteobacteria bacterium]
MKKVVKLWVDIALALLLIFQMPYILVGEKIHEWLGVIFLILILVHVKLNQAAFLAMFRRFWSSASRLANCLITSLAAASFIGLLISAPFISKFVLSFLHISGGAAFGRTAHLLCAYWGLVFFSLHLGLHLDKALGLARFGSGSPAASKSLAAAAPIVTVLAVAFGLKAFLANHIGAYLFLRQQFVFFDFEAPLWKILADNLFMMAAFAALAFWLRRLLRFRRSRP